MDRPLVPGDADHGAPLDDEWLHGVTFVGFSDDAVPDSDYETALPDADRPADPSRPPGIRTLHQQLADALRQAGAVAKSLGLAALLRLRQWFFGTRLRARRTQAALMVLLALALSVSAGVMFHRWLGPPRAKPLQAEAPPVPLIAPTVSVLVARDAIPRGHILVAKDLTWRPWPAERVKPSFIVLKSQEISTYSGYVVATSLASGEPLTESKIAAPRDRGFLSALLRPGMRAISVLIGPETAASGLIVPGDYIDAMLALPVPAYSPDGQVSNQERASVQTVVRNIRVLAIDQMVDGREGRAIVGQSATLEVTPKEAEIIVLANEIAFRGGMLTLTLRSLVHGADDEEPADGGTGRLSYMLDTDVSKLLTNRPIERRRQSALTIVRGSKIGQAGPPPRSERKRGKDAPKAAGLSSPGSGGGSWQR